MYKKKLVGKDEYRYYSIIYNIYDINSLYEFNKRLLNIVLILCNRNCFYFYFLI